MITSSYLSIIIINVNGLNAPVKRHRVAEWIKKTNKQKNKTHIYAAFKSKHTHRLKLRGNKRKGKLE